MMTTDYNSQAHLWSRDEPKTLSDYVARAAVLELFREFGSPASVLDIGCGEGYFARQIAKPGCRVIGIDSSSEMIRIAKEKEEKNPLGIEYMVVDALRMHEDASLTGFDICVGNFVAHYFTPEELSVFYSNIADALDEKGSFILAFSHPHFQLLGQPTTAIFEREGYHYIHSRGRHFNGYLPDVDGKVLRIGYVHSTLEDHFNALRDAGLAVTDIREPPVAKEVAEKHELFKGLEGNVGFMIMAGRKI